MANQIDPNVYHLSCRCPIEDVAALKTLACTRGVSLNSCVSDLLHHAVKNVSADAASIAWMQEQRVVNLKVRERADQLTASGKYRAKHPKKRGRPMKPRKRAAVINKMSGGIIVSETNKVITDKTLALSVLT